MARKKQLFSVRKNRYGNPLISARTVIPPVTIEGNLYNEVHIYATLCGISFTLRAYGKEVGYVQPLTRSTMPLNGIDLEKQVTTLVKLYEDGRASLHNDWRASINSVLV
jgi:hypothetical protein